MVIYINHTSVLGKHLVQSLISLTGLTRLPMVWDLRDLRDQAG